MASDDGEASEGAQEEVKYNTMRELIEKVWLPQCLTIGISYDLFWSLNPARIEPFKAAYKQGKDEEKAIINLTAWLNGQYVAEAIAACFGKNHKYPSQPIDLSGKPTIPPETEVIMFDAWATVFNERFIENHPESQ
jgi:hypothetical protein